MLVLSLVLLCTFFVGVFVWTVLQHFLTVDVPSTLQHPAKFRFLHCLFLKWPCGNIFERLGICSRPRFTQLLHGFVRTKKDARLVVTDLYFGTIPVRLFQSKADAGPCMGVLTSLQATQGGCCDRFCLADLYHHLCNFLALETDSVLLSIGYHCLNASIHFLKALETYSVDPSRVAICGDSTGGAYVVCVTQALVGRSDVPQIRAQVLIYPLKFMMTCMFKYMVIDFHWWEAILDGAFMPPDFWRKYKQWLSSDNIPRRFRKMRHQPVFPSPFNGAAYLENKHLLDVDNAPLIRDDETIAQLPKAFLVSCEHDILRDDTLLYMKRLEDQRVPVMWYHVEDGFHGSLLLFDKEIFLFLCSLKIVNAIANYIKSI
uniref:Arylacetamide deacetylase like 4 n=1 Tax=Panthera leo TaxID=9689 RepID=A0A8C8WSL8_PANLE